MQSVLVPINVCIQAIDNNQAVIECRDLVDTVSKSILAKADEIERAIDAETSIINCDQCAALMIQGVFCHGTGCPNAKKLYEDGERVRYLKCQECGSEVREDETCCEWPELTDAE